MNQTLLDFVMQIADEGLLLVIIISGPPLILSMIVGLAISLFQAVTQLQEQTLTFVPKMIVIFGTLAILGTWMQGVMLQFTQMCFTRFVEFIQ